MEGYPRWTGWRDDRLDDRGGRSFSLTREEKSPGRF